MSNGLHVITARFDVLRNNAVTEWALEAVCFRVGARQAGGRRADLGAPGRRTDEAVSASRGGRDQEPDSLQSILPRADAEEGACRPNRSRAPELAASGI